MKLKLIQEQKLFDDVTSLTFDNVFSDDYLDYVVTSHDGLGTVASNAVRMLDASGTEKSDSLYQIHQIYGTNSAENYQTGTKWLIEYIKYQQLIFQQMEQVLA
jgi:intergrase/recombinase